MRTSKQTTYIKRCINGPELPNREPLEESKDDNNKQRTRIHNKEHSTNSMDTVEEALQYT